MRTSTNHTKPEVNVRGNLKGMEEKKTERMTVPATDAEKTGQEVKKPVKVAKKEEKIFVEFGGRQILVNDVAESAKAHYKALFEKENGVLKTLDGRQHNEVGIPLYKVQICVQIADIRVNHRPSAVFSQYFTQHHFQTFNVGRLFSIYHYPYHIPPAFFDLSVTTFHLHFGS